ncbi:hypothetical protein L1987_15971 [Smallanthus sonchifolius]|uniref:Uncharacterized protein n=1 Tax=Smallanthus sonchifolius TaxID=185202 RepID=A0ACB9J724_9ASTR|nr:hypothetical protein L1987_15971 [Smallanthus sonchifolius]
MSISTSLLSKRFYSFLQQGIAESVDNPDWIHEFLIENLSGRLAIIRIKIDSYNLAHNFVRRFTVSKFFGDDNSMAEKEKYV